MKLEVGMYVRYTQFNYETNYKIGKLTSKFGHVEEMMLNIIKSSHNIIDLIEVGDYVNGGLVQGFEKLYIGFDGMENPIYLKDVEIYSIVTKEQFAQMEYRIGE